jgi:hydrogenase 3 maturation protease
MPSRPQQHPLKTTLSQRLKGAKRIAILGIGSDLRQDDVAGMLVAQSLEKFYRKRRSSPKLKSFLGATAPENLTGEIRDFKPDHIILVDTIDIKEKPGTILLLMADELGGGVSFSTHKLPAEVLVDYFVKSIGSKVMIIGIQPKSLDFGKSPSKVVISAAKEVSQSIKDALRTI